MIRYVLSVLFLLALLTPAVHAGPAAPDTLDLQQPDGSSFTASIHGDEFQNWTETEATGHSVIRNQIDGFWEYAEQLKNGQLRGSGIRVLPNGRNAPASIPKKLKPPRNREAETQLQQMLLESYQQRSANSGSPSAGESGAQAAPGDWVPTPVAGTKKMLVIMVGFADKALTTTPASWASAVFDTAASSVATYYQDNSFSSLSITPVSHTQSGNPAGVVSVTLASNHPNTAGSYTFSSDQAWGNSALQLAANYVDFNSLDTNGDGRLDTAEAVIYFIAAGYETSSNSGLSPSMWAHAWWTSGTGLTAGSKNVRRWALNGELYNATTPMSMGVIAHELGHQLCGLPDLYDTSGQNSAMGNFSLMAGGSWGRNVGQVGGTTPTLLDAWSREFLGWTTPVVPTASGTLSLDHPLASPSSAYKLINNGISSTEYFLVENRQPTGWDRGLRGMPYFGSGWSGGLLITHIDNTAGTAGYGDINSYTVNAATPGHQGVVPVQASTTTGNMLAVPVTPANFRGAATTLFYAGNNADWTPLSSPSSTYYSGSATDFSLTAISAPTATMTATLTVPIPPDPPTNVTAVPGDGQASVAFAAPAITGSSPILDYTATASPGGFTVTGAASPLTVSGLTNGTAYTFTVTARNSAGSSVPSSPSSSVTPKTVPAAPAITMATPGNARVTVAFTAPVSTGGSPILDYTVTADPGGLSATGAASPLTVEGLTNGTSYTFTVTARNSVGSSAQSAPSASVTPYLHIRLGGTGYPSVAAAYADINDGSTLELRDLTFDETLDCNRNVAITLRGGYDSSFTAAGGFSTLSGSLTVTSGSVTLENIAIQ